MIKKIILVLAVAIALPIVMKAQKFGIVDADQVLQTLPEMTAVQEQLTEASKRYEEEFKKLQDEMDKKFTEFQALGQDTPDSIKERRMAELQELDAKMTQFRNTAQQDLQRQQQNLMAPIEQKFMDAVKAVGQEGGYTFIFQEGISLFTGADVINVTADVKAKLGIN